MARDWSCPPGNSNLLATETPEKPIKKDPDGVCTEKHTQRRGSGGEGCEGEEV